MSIKLVSTGGGSVTIQEPNTASDFTLSVPAATATLLTSSSDLTTQVKSATNASGSAPVYSARAWVNFKGTDTVTINSSGNVSSITDNSAGNYSVNFTTAMSDINCSVATCIDRNGSGSASDNAVALFSFVSTSKLNVFTSRSSVGDYYDMLYVTVAVFR